MTTREKMVNVLMKYNADEYNDTGNMIALAKQTTGELVDSMISVMDFQNEQINGASVDATPPTSNEDLCNRCGMPIGDFKYSHQGVCEDCLKQIEE